jgi:hypothetical protein
VAVVIFNFVNFHVDMKKITLLVLFLLCMTSIVQAQRKKPPVKKITTVTKPVTVPARVATTNQEKKDTAVTKNVAVTDTRVIPISQMEQNKIYHWDNGQRSTPTGRQAGDPLAYYARVLGDSAVVVVGPLKKQ